MKHLPNLLTAARIALAPYIFYLMWNHDYRTALWWFAGAAVTDALDGFLARRFDAASRIGAYIDPLADKVLLSGSFLVLALAGAIPTWLAVVVLGRDVLLLAGAAIVLQGKMPRDLAPSAWGKWSTIVQMFYLLAVLAEVSIEALVWITAAITLWSGALYAWRFLANSR